MTSPPAAMTKRAVDLIAAWGGFSSETVMGYVAQGEIADAIGANTPSCRLATRNLRRQPVVLTPLAISRHSRYYQNMRTLIAFFAFLLVGCKSAPDVSTATRATIQS